MITSTNQVIPDFIVPEILELARANRIWFNWGSNNVELKACPELAASRLFQRVKEMSAKLDYENNEACSLCSMWAGGLWILDGPKIFRPTPDQCQALEQIEVKLALEDYAQPYPVVLIDLPDDRYAPFTAILCHQTPDRLLTFSLNSSDHEDDITTLITPQSPTIEASILKFNADCEQYQAVAPRALRVGLNSCLALANYGHYADYLFPKQVQNDRQLGKEATDRGHKARDRVRQAIQLVRFNQEVILHRTKTVKREAGEPTGREMPTGWRKGHWAMQPYGPHSSLRKRILRRPVLVRADRLSPGQTISTTYHT
jgi:hypothetical protein